MHISELNMFELFVCNFMVDVPKKSVRHTLYLNPRSATALPRPLGALP
jgi:hypothetical protein